MAPPYNAAGNEGEHAQSITRITTAPLLIFATPSTRPLVPSAWVRDGAHVVLVGSYRPDMHEVDGELVRRALIRGGEGGEGEDAMEGQEGGDTKEGDSGEQTRGRVVVDSRTSCAREAGELISAGVRAEEVIEIGELVLASSSAPSAPAPPSAPPPATPPQPYVADWSTPYPPAPKVEANTGRITLFKSVGLAAQDVAIAYAIVERAKALGVGCTVRGFD